MNRAPAQSNLASRLRAATKQAEHLSPLPAMPKPSIPAPETTADSIRSKIMELYRANSLLIGTFVQYSQSMAALSEEFHEKRLKEFFPSLVFDELTLACSLDARETPASLDAKLASLSGVTVKRVVYDRANHTYHLFV